MRRVHLLKFWREVGDELDLMGVVWSVLSGSVRSVFSGVDGFVCGANSTSNESSS